MSKDRMRATKRDIDVKAQEEQHYENCKRCPVSVPGFHVTFINITIKVFFLIYKLRFVPRFSKFKRMRMGVFEQLLPKRWGPALILAAGCSDAERLSKLKSTKCPQSVHPKVNWSRFSLALVSRKIFVFMKLVLFFKSQIKANIMQQAQKLVQVDALKVLCNVL